MSQHKDGEPQKAKTYGPLPFQLDQQQAVRTHTLQIDKHDAGHITVKGPTARGPVLPLAVASVWRAYVPCARRELTIFVQAGSYAEALRKVTAIAVCIGGASAEEGIYNLHSGLDLLAQGVSTNRVARLFENGWRGDAVISWVHDPVFAVRDPAFLMAAWLDAAGPIEQPKSDADADDAGIDAY